MRPVGRVVLARDYKEGENVAVAVLKVPRSCMEYVLGQVVYIDGEAYRIPSDLNPIKVGGNKLEHLLNNFYLERVEDGKTEEAGSVSGSAGE